MSTATTLTSRERVNRAMNHEDHDRVPRFETFWTDTIARWQGEGLEGADHEVWGILEADFAGLAGWLGPFVGHREVLSEDDETITLVNEWHETVREWKGRMGTPEHLGWGCSDRDKWEKTFKPAIENMGLIEADKEYIAYNEKMCVGKERWRFLATLDPFEALRHLLGDVDSMIMMMEDPEWIAEISRTWTDAMIRRLDQQSEYIGAESIDGVWCYGDMAFNHSTMCSPETYKELIWPDHKRFADWAHDHGCQFIYHTDGNINGVIDLYVEAGFDCLQPLEAKADMDVRTLFPKYAEDLTLFGNIDVMTMATNDLDKIEEEIANKFAVGKAHKAYIYHSDHSVPPLVSWETYQCIIELVKKHGQYE